MVKLARCRCGRTFKDMIPDDIEYVTCFKCSETEWERKEKKNENLHGRRLSRRKSNTE